MKTLDELLKEIEQKDPEVSKQLKEAAEKAIADDAAKVKKEYEDKQKADAEKAAKEAKEKESAVKKVDPSMPAPGSETKATAPSLTKEDIAATFKELLSQQSDPVKEELHKMKMDTAIAMNFKDTFDINKREYFDYLVKKNNGDYEKVIKEHRAEFVKVPKSDAPEKASYMGFQYDPTQEKLEVIKKNIATGPKFGIPAVGNIRDKKFIYPDEEKK
jgi:DNA repair exonuclease SbcCD ATPase subunit